MMFRLLVNLSISAELVQSVVPKLIRCILLSILRELLAERMPISDLCRFWKHWPIWQVKSEHYILQKRCVGLMVRSANCPAEPALACDHA